MVICWTLANPVEGVPTLANFELKEIAPVALKLGEIAIEVAYHTVAPGVRAKLGRETYTAMVRPGDVIPGMGVGKVVETKHNDFSIGDLVRGDLGWSTHAILAGDNIERLDRSIFEMLPLTSALGALGPAGLTAYFGLFDIAKIQPGETVLISSAAGAVGTIAGQLARAHGCKVIGLAGSDDKCADLTATFQFDAAINYRTSDNLDETIRAVSPEGFDVYFDNVGGAITDAAIRSMKIRGRIVVCGQTSEYNTKIGRGWTEITSIITKRLKVEGFILFDFQDRFLEASQHISGLLHSGKLVEKPTIVFGIENAATAFISLFAENSAGRVIVDP